MKSLYKVTITPKYSYHAGGFRSGAYSVEVMAESKREANKVARARLEGEGHAFTKSEAATFSAEKIEASEAPADRDADGRFYWD